MNQSGSMLMTYSLRLHELCHSLRLILSTSAPQHGVIRAPWGAESAPLPGVRYPSGRTN